MRTLLRFLIFSDLGIGIWLVDNSQFDNSHFLKVLPNSTQYGLMVLKSS